MTIIIPSMGRCGSTALFYAIRACVPPHNGRFVHYLADADIQDGEIIKTHDRAPEVIPDHWRVIYLHGDPEAIRRSVLAQSDEWKRAHFEHFGKAFVDDQKILDTHGGSMSIAIACDIEGFDLDICELDPDYFAAGKKRFENHLLQPRMFDAEPTPQPKQLTIE